MRLWAWALVLEYWAPPWLLSNRMRSQDTDQRPGLPVMSPSTKGRGAYVVHLIYTLKQLMLRQTILTN